MKDASCDVNRERPWRVALSFVSAVDRHGKNRYDWREVISGEFVSWFRFAFFCPAPILICSSLKAADSAKWKYFRTGNAEDSSATPRAGYALMGGGAQQDPAFKFLCERTNGGDFLIL